VAEVSGAATPSGLPPLLGRADGDPDAVREALRRDVVQPLGAPEAGLGSEEAGFVRKGRHSAGGARPYSGPAGRVEHCQLGVFLGDASRLGQARLDRELSGPQEWADAPTRCRRAGIPQDRRLATKPHLAQQRRARALAAGVPARWVTGDSVYGDERRRRMGREAPPQAYGLAVSGQEDVWRGGQQWQAKTILAAWPAAGGIRRRAGEGAKGPWGDDGRWWPLAEPREPGWRRWWLVRRGIREPSEVTAAVVVARPPPTREQVVRLAGPRGTIASGCEAATGKVGWTTMKPGAGPAGLAR
jgi:SRSO17 transposase